MLHMVGRCAEVPVKRVQNLAAWPHGGRPDAGIVDTVYWASSVTRHLHRFAKSAVVTVRKLAVLMLTLWKNETEFKWKEEAAGPLTCH